MIKFLENNRKYSILVLLLALFAIIGYQILDFRSFSERRNITKEFKDEIILIQNIYDQEDVSSQSFTHHLKQICDYSKLPLNSTSVEEWNDEISIDQSTKVVTISSTKNLSDTALTELLEFVSKGGTLILPKLNFDRRIKYFMGMKKEANMQVDTLAKGYIFKSNIIPNVKDLAFNKTSRHFGFTKDQFSESIKVLASAFDDRDYPVIFENKIGRGTVVVYNTNNSIEKKDRGILFSSLLLGLEGVPYPIANVSTIFLDDFPSPLYNEEKERIDRKEQTLLEFVTDVWWPDMRDLADSLDMKYTALVTFDYQRNGTPPFLFNQWDRYTIEQNNTKISVTDWISHNIINSGHELGFHGYNHISLLQDEWERPEYIGIAAKTAQKKWKISDLGRLPISYVPPSNKIDSVGLYQLFDNFTSLKYNSSLYLGQKDEGCYREFDVDPWNDKVYDYPRITSGFVLDDNEQIMHESMYLYTGIWTHFVHADDVFQRPDNEYATETAYGLRNIESRGWKLKRNGKEGLLTFFKNYLNKNKATYPMSRFYTVEKAVPITQQWRNAVYQHNFDSNTYTVSKESSAKESNEEYYWFVYISNQNYVNLEDQLEKTGIVYSKTPHLSGFLYNVRTSEPSLQLGHGLHLSNTRFLTDIVVENTLKEYQEYDAFEKNLIVQSQQVVENLLPNQSIRKPATKREWTNYYVANEKLDKASELVKSNLLQEKEIDSVSWNEYYMYMAWQNKQDEAWQTLKNYVFENPSKRNILYSRSLSKKYGYPSPEVQQEWLAMQYVVASDSLPILKEYYSNFNTPENAEEITKVLQKIDQQDPNYKNYQNYLRHLLNYDQERASKELAGLVPEETSSLWDIADEITWYYSNKKDFRNAYNWAAFADSIPFTNKMYWLSELKDFQTLENEYATYISKHNDDDEAKALMSKLMLYNKNTNRSWEVASTIQEDVVKDSVKELLNTEVIYAKRVTQKELLDKYTELFKEETQQQILTAIRKEEHNFAEVKLAILGDNNRQTSFDKEAIYTIRGKNKTKHVVTASHKDLYEIKNVSKDDEDNVDKVVYGANYTVKKQSTKGNKELSASIGVEVDEKQNAYLNAKTTLAISKEKQFTSVEATVEPAQTSAAYEKNIYRAQLSSYHYNRVADWLKGTLYVEGKYYTDKNYEASATARLDLESTSKKYFKVIPLVETSISRSSIDQVSDYPYYMVDKRFYTGGGAELKLGTEQSKFNISVEATTFIDNDLGNFNRYRANSSLKIGDYTVLKAAAELSTQPGAYSNFLSVGMSYIF